MVTALCQHESMERWSVGKEGSSLPKSPGFFSWRRRALDKSANEERLIEVFFWFDGALKEPSEFLKRQKTNFAKVIGYDDATI